MRILTATQSHDDVGEQRRKNKMMLGDYCDEVETKCNGVCSDTCRILAVALLNEDETSTKPALIKTGVSDRSYALVGIIPLLSSTEKSMFMPCPQSTGL